MIYEKVRTLGQYRDAYAIAFGEKSPAVKFLDHKIAKQGRDMTVEADHSQMLHVLNTLAAMDDKA